MHFVKTAKYLGDWRVLLEFEDSARKTVDLAPYLDGEVFEPLKDKVYFASFRVHPELETIVWPNDADLSPDFLYEIGVAASETARAG